jgi:hypothetical protein
MQVPLSKKEVHNGLTLLNDKQQDFILRTLNQSKKSKWLEVLARNKGISLRKDTPIEGLEDLIDDWVLLEIKDSGFGNKHYRCMCGMPLRYQYIVLNKKTKEQIGLGETCFQNHTNLPVEVVKDIVNEFHKIDLFRDEIINKFMTGRFVDGSSYLHLENLPPVIREQLELELPLTDKQIQIVEHLKYVYEINVRTQKLLSSLKPEACTIVEALSGSDREEILEKLADDDFYHILPDGFRDEEIEHYLSLGLPLLDRQIEKIYRYNRNLRRKQEEERKAEMEEYWRSIREETHHRNDYDSHSSITYETLLDRHMDTLIKVTEREPNLSRGMKNDWERLKNMVTQLREGKEFDYSSFKLNLTMICYSLHLRNEPYL